MKAALRSGLEPSPQISFELVPSSTAPKPGSTCNGLAPTERSSAAADI